ncbi:MAG: hypothetical protein O7G88_09455 [bacterium]|nr:hypothetical protein [bacterium]
MDLRWHIWCLIPGLHWFAWFQVGNLTREAIYYWLGLLYASPLFLFPLHRQLSLRLIIGSWLLSMLHLQLRKGFLSQRIAKADGKLDEKEDIRQALLQAALIHKGRLSVTQGVMETGKSFDDVEGALKRMVQSGYVFTRNQPETGIIEYVFKELL